MTESIEKEIEEKKRRATKGHEEEFQTLIVNKIKEDPSKHKKESALTLLIETFGDFIHDHKFISWLSSKFDYYPGRLKSLINNTRKVFVQRNSLPNFVLNKVYSFWINNSIPSIDRRSDHDAIYVN